MKITFYGFINRPDRAKEISVKLKICQYKLSKLKCKEKERMKGTEQNTQNNGVISKGTAYAEYQKEKRKENGAEEIFEVIIAENVPKLMTVTRPQSRKLREHQAG